MSTSTGAPYLRIANEIRRRITAGELRPGDTVPSTRQLTREFGVALATATKALAVLRQEGVVTAVPRVGTVVAGVAPAPPAAPRRVRTGEPAVTLEGIVQAAVRIADTEGIAALSMRRVAADIGVPTMSLYRYVPSKEDLILRMVDAVFAEDPLPEPAPHWRTSLEDLCHLQWAICRRHPWVARRVSITRPMAVPNGMAHTEAALRALEGTGLDRATMVHAAVTIAGHVVGAAMHLEQEVEAEQDSGLSNEEWYEAQDLTLGRLLASGRFPMLASLDDIPDFDLNLDIIFELGLRLLLDGLAAMIESAGTSPTLRRHHDQLG
ncbi:TetR/AcrR family transcriptional regulator C-terminal domain-containing protein [Micromonospora sp. CPCC 206061]|uniref:TetR/AcrR family transcriptional regulator C-terminal domain-containing protein n=1 Tax=Micromonospora sp. CPCC 206061 TaxID=3122410 RepID=UPI002FEF76F5